MAEEVSGAQPGVEPKGAASSAAFDLDTWLKDQPKEALEGLSERFAQGANAYINEQYGDVLPVLEEITKDEKLRNNFKKLVRDGKVDREELEFLLDTGIVTYEEDIRPRKTVRGGPGADGTITTQREIDPNDPGQKALTEVEALKEKLHKDELADQQVRYENYRRNEMIALMRERPDLSFKEASEKDPAYRKAAHIAEVAEARTKANYERGVQKVVSYKEVADELDAVLGREKPPAAPRTTHDRLDQKPQAPKTVAESKDRMRETLAKAGGLRALAEASRRG